MVWADGSAAHGVHTVVFHDSEPLCGILTNLLSEALVTTVEGRRIKKFSEYWTLSVKLMRCKYFTTRSQIRHHLCEFPAAQKGTGSYNAVRELTFSTLGRKDVVSRFVSCQMGHLAHTFVVCHLPSACWAEDDVSFGSDRDFWDIPSYTTCLAPLSPLPPSYACASGDRVPYTFVCDHRRDCSDSSDENFCQHPSCEQSLPLQCGDVRQVF